MARSQHPAPHVALCYTRLSVTKDASDLTSPARQRANLQAACDKYGWTPEWYEDAHGHKSATREENRPAWLALKARLRDPDVAALVVNEQSRAMRNAWRAIKLFEELPAFGVKLHLASLDRTIDITSPDGRMTAYFQAFLDDLYALDASRRSRDSVRYRKAKGVSIGIPPFGTLRDPQTGFLIPSPHGAWLLPDGTWTSGTEGENPPVPEALWRGYFDCAQRILDLYRSTNRGYKFVATQIHQEGYAFRDRWNQPRAVASDDVRRVTSNWREYAGLIHDGRAKEKVAHRLDNPSQSLFDTGRAVMDLEMLRQVAQTQQKRSITTRPPGTLQNAIILPLAHLLFCQRCDHDRPGGKRARLISWNKQGRLRYRHSEATRCTGSARSLPADIVEGQFLQLVQALSVRPDALEWMARAAIHAPLDSEDGEEAFEEKKKAALVRHRRALKNNLTLFQQGDIDDEEYFRQKDFHERQIAHWESRTTDRQRILLELTTCLELVQRLQTFWADVSLEDRRILAHSLFDEILYDLDTQRITSFKVKPWAEPFLMLRAALYEDEMGEEMKNRFNSGVSRDGSSHDPNGTRTRVLTLKG